MLYILLILAVLLFAYCMANIIHPKPPKNTTQQTSQNKPIVPPVKTQEEIKNELERWKKERAELLNGNVIFFDTETTGVDMSGKDEILSLAIVDKEGKVLFNELIKPTSRQRWPKAQEINGISPAMVKDKKKIGEYQEQIQQIFSEANLVVGYNTEFDLSFLRNAGIEYNGKVADVMLDFAEIKGDWDERHQDFRWQKLSKCAEYYGYDWGKTAAHDSLADTLATRFCFYRIVETQGNFHTYKM